MQSPNNISDSWLQSRRARWSLVIVILLIVAGIFTFVSEKNHNSARPPKADQEQSTIFEGMSSFIDNGLTTDQVNGLIKAFSKFSPGAKTVSIDTDSLSPGPHNPDSADPFNINFNVSVDSTAYKGNVIYSNLESIQLVLMNLDGKQVFDSGVITASP